MATYDPKDTKYQTVVLRGSGCDECEGSTTRCKLYKEICPNEQPVYLDCVACEKCLNSDDKVKSRICTRCNIKVYCCVDAQKNDLVDHREHCKAMAGEKEVTTPRIAYIDRNLNSKTNCEAMKIGLEAVAAAADCTATAKLTKTYGGCIDYQCGFEVEMGEEFAPRWAPYHLMNPKKSDGKKFHQSYGVGLHMYNFLLSTNKVGQIPKDFGSISIGVFCAKPVAQPRPPNELKRTIMTLQLEASVEKLLIFRKRNGLETFDDIDQVLCIVSYVMHYKTWEESIVYMAGQNMVRDNDFVMSIVGAETTTMRGYKDLAKRLRRRAIKANADLRERQHGKIVCRLSIVCLEEENERRDERRHIICSRLLDM